MRATGIARAHRLWARIASDPLLLIGPSLQHGGHPYYRPSSLAGGAGAAGIPSPQLKSFFRPSRRRFPFPRCWPRAVDGSCADRVSRRDTGGGVREMMTAHGRGDHRNSLTVNHSCNEPAQRVGAGGLLWANFFPSTASSTRYAIIICAGA